MTRDETSAGYTFYGDLLGVSSYYEASPNLAYCKLSLFYNTTYEVLVPVRRQGDAGLYVEMLSDSLLVYGDHVEHALEALQNLYRDLLLEGLLLRGAVVSGKLQYDRRQQQRYFEKKLPVDNCLARAVGLEKTQKGARLLIETSLAGQLLNSVRDWKTVEGYHDNPKPRVPLGDIRRRVCPTPDGRCFEFLYPWYHHGTTDFQSWRGVQDKLEDLAPFFEPGVGAQFEATLDVIDRSILRAEQTWRALAPST